MRRFPKLGKCERCGKRAVERHHIDGNSLNNERSNVMFVCRRCHMMIDGRMKLLRAGIGKGRIRGFKLSEATKAKLRAAWIQRRKRNKKKRS